MLVAVPNVRSRCATRMPIVKPATTSIAVATTIRKNTEVAACGVIRNSMRQAMNTIIDRPWSTSEEALV